MPVTLAEAQRTIAAAVKQAESISVKLSIVVVDPHGDIVAVGKMDGGRPFSTEFAVGKAMVSALFGRPSAEMAGAAQIMTPINASKYGNKLIFLQGAVPLMKNGEVYGAIGTSGGAAQQDEDCAKAGAAAL